MFEVVPKHILPYVFYSNSEDGTLSYEGNKINLNRDVNEGLHDFSWQDGFCDESKWKSSSLQNLLSDGIVLNSMMGCCLMVEILDRCENLEEDLRFRIGIVDPVWRCRACGKIIPEQ